MDDSQKYVEQKRSESKEYIEDDWIYMNLYESQTMYSDISQISDCLRERGNLPNSTGNYLYLDWSAVCIV